MRFIGNMFFLAILLGALSAPKASAQQAVAWNKSRIKVDIPISWEITGSDFVEGGIATQSESYREIWTFEFEKGFRWSLSSPRGKVSVIPLGLSDSSLPQMLALQSDDFASLLGVTDFDHQNWKEFSEKSVHDLIFISLGAGANSTQEISLYISKTDYYSVILMLWR